MGNVYPLRSIEDEASEWIARTEHGCTPDQRKRFDAWLAADLQHRAVFDEMSRHWQRLSATAAIAARLNRTDTASSHPFPRNKYRYLAAASVLLAVVAASYLAYPFSVSAPKIYATAIGAHRTLPLSDGSTVDLNTATQIEVEFNKQARLVRLTSGEALFNVAKDPDRPFTVIAGSSIVRAVGTAFSVRIASDHTSVLVTEGRVLISPTPLPPGEGPGVRDSSTLICAGEQVRIATSIGPIAKVEPRDLDRALAWRRGVLNIQDQPLGEVIAEVERYSAVRIRIADPSLTGIKVGGYFKATDIDAFLTLLEGQFPIRAERASPNLIVLHRSSSLTPLAPGEGQG